MTAPWETIRARVMPGLVEAPIPEESRARVSAEVAVVLAGAFSLAQIHLKLERAAASPDVRARLDAVAVSDGRDRERSVTPVVSGGPKAPKPVPSSAAAVSVIAFLVAVLGPVFAFPSERLDAGFILPLEPGAIVAGVLTPCGAAVLLWSEARRKSDRGSRTRLFHPGALVVPVLFAAGGIYGLGVRIPDLMPFVPTAAVVGLVLLALSAVLDVGALVLGLRHRARENTPEATDERMLRRLADARRGADLDRALSTRVREEVAADGDRAATRAAVLEGVAELYRRDELDEDAVVWLLERIRG